MENKYRIVSLGRPVKGYSNDDVLKKLTRLLKNREQLARKLLSGKIVVIRSGLDRKRADTYHISLLSIGLQSRVEHAHSRAAESGEESTVHRDFGPKGLEHFEQDVNDILAQVNSMMGKDRLGILLIVAGLVSGFGMTYLRWAQTEASLAIGAGVISGIIPIIVAVTRWIIQAHNGLDLFVASLKPYRHLGSSMIAALELFLAHKKIRIKGPSFLFRKNLMDWCRARHNENVDQALPRVAEFFALEIPKKLRPKMKQEERPGISLTGETA